MLLMTSPKPPGAVTLPACVRCIDTGNRKLPVTATIADRNVEKIYKTITVLNLLLIPSPALDKAEATNTKTRSGAIAFNALTNN